MSDTDDSRAGTSKSFSNNLQYLNLVIHQAHNFHLLFDNNASVDLSQVRNARNRFGDKHVNGEHESLRRYQENSLCDNYDTLINEQLWNRPVEDRHFTSDSPGLMASLDQCWSEARLQDCTNEACLELKTAMDDIVPRCQQCGAGDCTCGYGSFRSNTTTAMSCQLALCPDPLDDNIQTDDDFKATCDEFVESKAVVIHTHIANFVAACVEILKFYTTKATDQQQDHDFDDHLLLLNVSNVIHWMANIQYEKGIGLVGFGSWTSKITIAPEVRRQIWDACTKAQELKICEHRLWTLIRVSDRKEADVPDIVDALTQYQEGHSTDLRWLHDEQECCRETLTEMEECPSHPSGEDSDCCLRLHDEGETCLWLKHTRCSSSKCQTTTMNGSEVKGLHMHGNDPDCMWQDVESSQDEDQHPVAEGPVHKSFEEYCTEKTSHAVGENLPTAWIFPDGTLEKPSALADRNTPYVALSHVWSDGTGTATPCMLQFLKTVAKNNEISSADRKCEAIWWDAISVPTDGARAKALQTMNDNYRHAECTIVHDRQLMLYQWKRKEDICLALVLSTWFTRAWTAMELAVSPRVKVLVRNDEDPENPLLMDLDDEILAFGPECVSRAHWIAKAWIRRLREPVDDIGDISAILSRRTSKYPRDQSVVAALLADVPDLETKASEAEILEKTLLYLGKVPYAGLMHGQPTITNSKGFSWSPCAVADMQIGLPADIESRAASDYFGMLDVFQGGSVRGEWQMEYLNRDMVEHLHDVSTDILLRLKVASALDEPSKCLLLRPRSESEKHALLVGVMQVDDDGGCVQCCYIGLVSYDSELEFKQTHQFIIGNHDGSYGILDARQAMEQARLESAAEDIDETPLPDSWGSDHEDSDTTDAFQSAIEENSEPAMRHLLRYSGWEPVLGHRNNKALFTRPWRHSEIHNDHDITKIYGYVHLGLLFLKTNRENHLTYARNAYVLACRFFKGLPHTDPSENITLYRKKLLIKAHIYQLEGHLKYASMDQEEMKSAINPFGQVLGLQRLEKKFTRFSEDPDLQQDDHVVYQDLDGFGLTTSQHGTSQWKRLQLDSRIHLTLLHIGLDEWEQAADHFFDVIRHFTKNGSGASGSDVQQRHKGVLEMALRYPEPPADQSTLADDQQPVPDGDKESFHPDHIRGFYHIARRALAAFVTIFRGDHLLIDLTRFYIGRAFHLLALVPHDATLTTAWVKATGTGYLESAKKGLEMRHVLIPPAILERIDHSLAVLSENTSLPRPTGNE